MSGVKSGSGGLSMRKKRFHWNAGRDVELLHKVMEHRPWDYGRKTWNTIGKELQPKYNVTPRSCMLRFELLVDHYKAQDTATLRRSGTEEEFDTRDQLLEEVRSLMDSQSQLGGILQSQDIDLHQEDNTQYVGDIIFEGDTVDVYSQPDDVDQVIESPIDAIRGSSCDTGTAGKTKQTTPTTTKASKLVDKLHGDRIRKTCLDNSLEANLAADPAPKRIKKGSEIDNFLCKKMAVEEKKLKLDEIISKQTADDNFKLAQNRLDMEERLALRKLELESEEKEKERKWRFEEHAKDLELKEKYEEREHQRQIELIRERSKADEKLCKILECFVRKE